MDNLKRADIAFILRKINIKDNIKSTVKIVIYSVLPYESNFTLTTGCGFSDLRFLETLPDSPRALCIITEFESHIYLYRAFYITDCIKAASQ